VKPALKGPRPARAKFDITCGACGTAAQVPFRPLEGRDVFCQSCYRARRGPPAVEAQGAGVDVLVAGLAEGVAEGVAESGLLSEEAKPSTE
jgi:CxxC-x17-CxxC domain-containing protein